MSKTDFSQRYWINLIPLAFLFLACSRDKDSTDTFARGIGDEPKMIVVQKIFKSIPFKDLADSVQYVALQSIEGGKIFIGNVEKVMISNDRFYVLDTRVAKGLFCFDIEGNHLFSINQRGNGSGEFMGISDFDVNEETGEVYIYDEGNGRMSLFSLDGDYMGDGPKLSTQGTLPDNFILLGDKLVLYNKNNCNDRGCNSIQVVSNLTNELIAQGIDNKHLSGFNVDMGTPIIRNGTDVAFTQLLNDTIYFLGTDLEMKAPYVVDFGKYKMSEKERSELLNNPTQISSFIALSNKTQGPHMLILTMILLWSRSYKTVHSSLYLLIGNQVTIRYLKIMLLTLLNRFQSIR